MGSRAHKLPSPGASSVCSRPGSPAPERLRQAAKELEIAASLTYHLGKAPPAERLAHFILLERT